jgi:hypothetical protein
MGVIVGLGLVTYFLVQSGKGGLLGLYIFATGLLVALLVAVAFDLGVGKSSPVVIEEEPDVAEAPVPADAPKVKNRKRRR